MIALKSVDHFVLTVADIPASLDFFQRVLGMEPEAFGEGRFALKFAGHKINLHQAGQEFKPNAKSAVTGSGDFCLTVDNVLAARQHVEGQGVDVFEGPVPRTGANGPITSIYLRDPDGNLIELSEYGDD